MPLTRTMLEGFRNGRFVRVAIIASARVFPIPGKRVSASASATLMSIHASAFSCACPMDSSSRFGRFGAIAMATMRFSLAEFADWRLGLGLGFSTASAVSSRSTMALARSSCACRRTRRLDASKNTLVGARLSPVSFASVDRTNTTIHRALCRLNSTRKPQCPMQCKMPFHTEATSSPSLPPSFESSKCSAAHRPHSNNGEKKKM